MSGDLFLWKHPPASRPSDGEARKLSGFCEPQFQPAYRRDPVESWPVQLREMDLGLRTTAGRAQGQGLEHKSGMLLLSLFFHRAPEKRWSRQESSFQCRVCFDQESLCSFRISRPGDPFLYIKPFAH